LSDESIEREKEKDDSLRGLSAIRQSLLSGHIGTKVYTKSKIPRESDADAVETASSVQLRYCWVEQFYGAGVV